MTYCLPSLIVVLSVWGLKMNGATYECSAKSCLVHLIPNAGPPFFLAATRDWKTQGWYREDA